MEQTEPVLGPVPRQDLRVSWLADGDGLFEETLTYFPEQDTWLSDGAEYSETDLRESARRGWLVACLPVQDVLDLLNVFEVLPVQDVLDLLADVFEALTDPRIRRCAHCGRQGTARDLTPHLADNTACLVAEQPLVTELDPRTGG